MRAFRMVNMDDGSVQTMNEIQASTAHDWISLFEVGPTECRPDRQLAHPTHRVRSGYAYFDIQLDELIFWVPAPGSALGGHWVDTCGLPINRRGDTDAAGEALDGGKLSAAT